WLARIEAVEDLYFCAREEVRQADAGRQHRASVPVHRFAHRTQQRLVGPEFLMTVAVEKPRGLVATRANRGLQRPQHGERVAYRAEEQVAARHQRPDSVKVACKTNDPQG